MKSRLLAVAVVLCAAWAFADLGKYQGWDETYVQHLMTKKELKAFKKLKTEQEAEEFVALFWARRDTTPGTPRNEFRERCETLAEQADAKYSTDKVKGALSDRGKVLLLLGPPFASKQMTAADSELGLGQEGVKTTAAQAAFTRVEYEVWIYRKEQLERLPFNVPSQELKMQFKKEEGQKNYYLDRSVPVILQALDRAVEGWVKSPDLKTVPEWARSMGIGPFAAKADALLAGTEPPAPDKGLATWAVFFDSHQNPYGSALVFLPEESFAEMPPQVQTYIRLVGPDGAEAGKVDEPVEAKKTLRGWYVDRSFRVKPGLHKLLYIVGAPDGTVFFSDILAMDVPDLLAEGAENLWLTLSNDVQPLKSAFEDDPFTFGGVKVVPNLSGVFKTSDDLWYFYNIMHPQLDPATNNPKLSQKVEILKEGRRVKGSPETELGPEALTALSEGRWAVGNAYNIGADLKLEPGAYTFKLTVKDKLSGREFVQERPFKVVP